MDLITSKEVWDSYNLGSHTHTIEAGSINTVDNFIHTTDPNQKLHINSNGINLNNGSIINPALGISLQSIASISYPYTFKFNGVMSLLSITASTFWKLIEDKDFFLIQHESEYPMEKAKVMEFEGANEWLFSGILLREQSLAATLNLKYNE